MLVIVGAGGRSGRAFVKGARARGLAVRAVVRDGEESRSLVGVLPLADVAFAAPEVREALEAVLGGASTVISCIDPRAQGPGARHAGPGAGAAVVEASLAVGARRVVHVASLGAYRWSSSAEARACFGLDRGVRRLVDRPWTLVRVGCWTDLLLDGHVRPPDGGWPHPLVPGARYAPVTREDMADLVLDRLDRLVPGRSVSVGGPRVWTGRELAVLAAPYLRGAGRRTRAAPLPGGDVAVAPATTRAHLGRVPATTVEEVLASSSTGSPEPLRGVRGRAPVGPHPADRGGGLPGLDAAVRWVVHDQLVRDLAQVGVEGSAARLDFRKARGALPGQVGHLDGVEAWVEGRLVRRGEVRWVRDGLADVFECWWASGPALPERVWRRLDLGVRRRLATDPELSADPLVVAFREGRA